MSHLSADVVYLTMFAQAQVSVSHQRHVFTRDIDNTVNHKMPIFDPCKYDIAPFQCRRLYQHHAIAPPYNKRKHTAPVHGKRHFDAFVDQANRLGHNQIVANHAGPQSP